MDPTFSSTDKANKSKVQKIIGKLDTYLPEDFVASDVANYEPPETTRKMSSYVSQSSHVRWTVNEDNIIIDGLHYNY